LSLSQHSSRTHSRSYSSSFSSRSDCSRTTSHSSIFARYQYYALCHRYHSDSNSNSNSHSHGTGVGANSAEHDSDRESIDTEILSRANSRKRPWPTESPSDIAVKWRSGTDQDLRYRWCPHSTRVCLSLTHAYFSLITFTNNNSVGSSTYICYPPGCQMNLQAKNSSLRSPFSSTLTPAPTPTHQVELEATQRWDAEISRYAAGECEEGTFTQIWPLVVF
jgi:hypothetical protein